MSNLLLEDKLVARLFPFTFKNYFQQCIQVVSEVHWAFSLISVIKMYGACMYQTPTWMETALTFGC